MRRQRPHVAAEAGGRRRSSPLADPAASWGRWRQRPHAVAEAAWRQEVIVGGGSAPTPRFGRRLPSPPGSSYVMGRAGGGDLHVAAVAVWRQEVGGSSGPTRELVVAQLVIARGG